MPIQGNRVFRHSLPPGWTGPMWGRTGSQRHGTTQTVTEPGLSTVAQAAPFQALRLSPWTGIFSAQQGKDSLMLPQSSCHRGEYVLGAAVCYKYTSESENQMPPASLPSSSMAWGPSPPRPTQSGLLFKAGTLNKGRLDGQEGDKSPPQSCCNLIGGLLGWMPRPHWLRWAGSKGPVD